MSRSLRSAAREQQRGFTLLEALIAAGLLSFLMLGVFSVIRTGQRSARQHDQATALDERLGALLTRIEEEVRWSSRTAEDSNNNGVLDAGEDTNGNGRLERDWAVTTTSLTFNPRAGATGFGLPVTWRRSGNRLERLQMVDEDGTTETLVLSRDVDGFNVTQTGNLVQVVLQLRTTQAGGRTMTRTRRITVAPRN